MCFDAIRSIIDSLGALASEFDMPFVAFLADSNINEEVDGKPIKAYWCVNFYRPRSFYEMRGDLSVDRLNPSEENARIHSYCIDDMTRYFVRYVIDNAKYTSRWQRFISGMNLTKLCKAKRATPEDILWIKSTAFKNQEALSLLLTPTEDLTDIKEDEDAIIEALHKYLLSTYSKKPRSDSVLFFIS